MEAKHTKGPWRVVNPTSDTPSRAMVCAGGGFIRIYDAPLTDETAANARLIAAAPDLLHALKECEAMMRGAKAMLLKLNPDVRLGVHDAVEEQARAAISKAAGVGQAALSQSTPAKENK